MIAAHI